MADGNATDGIAYLLFLLNVMIHLNVPAPEVLRRTTQALDAQGSLE